MRAGGGSVHDAAAAPGLRLLRAAAASGVATAAAAAAGLARVKLHAVYLGAAGLGVVSQLQNLLNALAVLAMLGLGVGITREVARARRDDDRAAIRRLLSSSRTLALAAALLLGAAVTAASRPLSSLLLGTADHALHLALMGPALAFVALARVPVEVLHGFRDYAANARVTVASSALGVLLLAPLLLLVGLTGAVLAIPLTAAATFLLARHRLLAGRPWLRGAGSGIDGGTARALLSLGALSLLVAFADQLALLVIRSGLIRDHGVEGNGLFQGVWGLSQYALQMVIGYVSGYSFARVHEVTGPQAVAREVDGTVRVTLLLLAPLSAGIILFRRPLVTVFLSEEFRGALDLFPYQAAGDLLRGVGMALGVGVLAVARPRVWLAMGLSVPVSFVAAFGLLSPVLGLTAASAAHAVAGAVHLGFAAAAMRASGALRLSRATWITGAASLVLVGGAIVATTASRHPVVWGAGLLAAWAAAAVRRSELRRLWRGPRRP